MSEAITQAAAYDLIDRFLRNNLYDDDYTKYSEALEALSQSTPSPQPVPVDELPDLNPEDFVVDVVLKQLGGFAPVTTHGVRVTHKPSLISVVVDNERSQHRNRQLALEALRAIIHHNPGIKGG